MEIIIYIFVVLFIFMALVLMFIYRCIRYYGVFLLGLIYGVAAGLVFVLMHWWSLVAGFVLVWLLRLFGLDPDMWRDGLQS